MKNCLISFSLLLLLSCNNKYDSTLELNFSSQNNEVLKHIKSFYLTEVDSSLHAVKKVQSFRNINCEVPNKFILKNIKSGLYLGLMQIENNAGQEFNIAFDSIQITPGKNYLTKEINLGSVHL